MQKPLRSGDEALQRTQRKSDFNIQVACVTLAKGTHRRQLQQLAVDGQKPTAPREKNGYSKKFKSHMFNTIVCFNADAGKLANAENWMERLDTRLGITPDVRSLNNLLHSCAKLGEFDKAEDWIARCGMPALHPELAGLEPTAESYDIMIQMFTRAGELHRAEKWIHAIEKDMQIRPNLTSQLGLIKACLQLEQVVRAHRWATHLVKNGCAQNATYAPDIVKAERVKYRSSQRWNVSGLIDTVITVTEALAGMENSHAAHQWLRYLVGCGLKPEDAYGTWEKVRKVHPMQIISTVLSGEQADPSSPGLPPRTKLASLFGEGVKRSSLKSPNTTLDRPTSQASAMLGDDYRSESSMSKRSTNGPPGRTPRTARCCLSDSGRRSGAASPSLRKFLDAKSRGATPSLAWARSETASPYPQLNDQAQATALPALSDAKPSEQAPETEEVTEVPVAQPSD